MNNIKDILRFSTKSNDCVYIGMETGDSKITFCNGEDICKKKNQEKLYFPLKENEKMLLTR